MKIKIAQTENEKEQAFFIRKEVFVKEQNVSMEEEMDEYDDEAIHFICEYNHDVVGASRLRFVEQYGKLERICVLKHHRGKSIGQNIINYMEQIIIENGFFEALLNAQTNAINFYEKLGYAVVSDEFIDAGIPHVTMTKRLPKK